MRYYRLLVRDRADGDWFFVFTVFETLDKAKAYAARYLPGREYRVLGHEAISYSVETPTVGG